MDAMSHLGHVAGQILQLARKKALFFQHDQVGPEHLLLALAAVPEAAASRLLRQQGIDPQAVVRALVSRLVIGRTTDEGQITLSPSAQQVLTAADQEARALGWDYIGTEHLLLGILAQADSPAAQTLAQLGLDVQALRGQMAALPKDPRERRPPPKT